MKSIAVIGAGNWGKNLVRTLHDMGALVAVAEASEEIRSRVGESYPEVGLLDSHESLLSDSRIDAVAIATPVPTHHSLGKAFLEAGKDVFIEKPMTLTSSEAEDLVETAERLGRILMVGHLLMFQPAIAKIRELLAEGAVGRLFTIHQVRRKLGRARAVENVLWSFGVHDIAVLLSLVGEKPVKVVAAGHQGLTEGVEDDAYLHLTFANGVKAHLHNSWLWPRDQRSLTVVGSEGMITFDEFARQVVLHRKHIEPGNLQNVDEGEQVVFEGAARPLDLEMQHFLDCLETREKPLSAGDSGLEVIRVLEESNL